MALKQTYIANYCSKQVIFEDAYIKIVNTNGDKELQNVEVATYDSNQQYILDKTNYSFTPDVSDTAPNFIKQGYEYLKRLEEYADAVDC